MRGNKLTLRDFRCLLLGAVLYTLAFPPYEWTWAAWLALTPLFLILRRVSPGPAFFAGLLFGVLWCLGQGYWLYWTMTESFALRPFFSIPFLLANFVFFAGLPTGLVTTLACWLLRHGHPLFIAVGVPALWVSGEFSRANPMFGVSWGVLGYTQYHHAALIQIADITGVYGISFVLALSGYTAAELWLRRFVQLKSQKSKGKSQKSKGARDWGLVLALPTSSVRTPDAGRRTPDAGRRTPDFQAPSLKPPKQVPGASTQHSALSTQHFVPRSPWPAVGVLAGSLAFMLSYGVLRLHQYAEPAGASPLRIAVIQGNVPAEHRWQPRFYASTLLKYAAVTRRGLAGTPGDLALWPEFALSFYLDKEPLLRAQLGEFVRMLQTPLLLGAPRLEEAGEEKRYYNSAYLFSSTGELVDVYDKLHLVPFAEYRPFSVPRLLLHTPEAPSEFTPGTRPTVFSLPSGSFGVTICYEAAYPSATRRLVREGAQLLVNISNDTWLGGATAAVGQHFAMNVLRAVENKRPLVRAATAGVSGFVDPTGRAVLTSSAEEVILQGAVVPRNELTIYARWGDWFSLCCLGFSASMLAWAAWSSSLMARLKRNHTCVGRESARGTAHASV